MLHRNTFQVASQVLNLQHSSLVFLAHDKIKVSSRPLPKDFSRLWSCMKLFSLCFACVLYPQIKTSAESTIQQSSHTVTAKPVLLGGVQCPTSQGGLFPCQDRVSVIWVPPSLRPNQPKISKGVFFNRNSEFPHLAQFPFFQALAESWHTHLGKRGL